MADPEYLPTNSNQADVIALQIAFAQIVKLLSERDPEFKRELMGRIHRTLSERRKLHEHPYGAIVESPERLVDTALENLLSHLS